jgi:PAS domain S-box-containing protein
MLAFAIMTLVPIIVANLAVLCISENSARNAALGETHKQAEVLARTLNSEFASILRSLQVAADNNAVRSMESDQLAPVLRDVAANHPELLIVLVTDADGQLVARSDGDILKLNYSERDYFKELKAKEKLTVSSPLISKSTGKLGIAVSVPIHDAKDKLVGVLIGTVGLEKAIERINQTTGGTNRRAYVVDAEGKILMHAQIGKMKIGADASPWKPVRFALQGATGSVQYDFNGEPHIAGYSPVPCTGWGLVVHESWADITHKLALGRRTTLAWGIASLAVALLVIRGLVRRLFAPISHLTDGVRRVSEGDLQVRVPVNTRDEIGVLGERFNIMTAQLRETIADLEENKEKFIKVFQKSPAGMVITHLDNGKIVEVNSEFEKIFRCRSSDVKGKSSVSLGFWLTPQDRNDFRQAVNDAGQVDSLEVYFSRLNGESFPALISACALRIKGENFVISHITDMTERRKAEMEITSLNTELEERVAQRTAELSGARDELQANTEILLAQQQQLKEINQTLEERSQALEESQKRIQQKNRELIAADRYKSEFLANVSHELRTPLNSMLLLSRLLSDNKGGNLDPKQVEFAELIHRSGSDLLILINDILDFSKIEAGQMEFHCDEVNLPDLGLVMQRTFGHTAEQKKLSFSVVISPDAPATIRSDSQRLQQVLRNLVSNAIKFTEHGGVTLTLRAPRENEPSGMAVALSVKDTGIGISPEQCDLVFQLFQQADGSTNRRYGGVGLGLSISQGLARCLGGHIRLESSVGTGSTFTLFLPPDIRDVPAFQEINSARLAIPSEEPRPDPQDKSEKEFDDSPFTGKRVLLVDDDIRNVYSLTHVLEGFGMQVVPAVNGQDALEKLETEPSFDMVLMDIMMPVMDGFEAIPKIRSQPRFQDVPILALTAKAMPGDRERCLQAGACDYLCKPIDLDKLTDLLKKWLRAPT